VTILGTSRTCGRRGRSKRIQQWLQFVLLLGCSTLVSTAAIILLWPLDSIGKMKRGFSFASPGLAIVSMDFATLTDLWMGLAPTLARCAG